MNALEALKAYQQADAEGVMVLVSRQACDECAAEIERLRADAIQLQARKPDGGDWTNIFPAQLQWMAKEGYDVRALETADQQQGTDK